MTISRFPTLRIRASLGLFLLKRGETRPGLSQLTALVLEPNAHHFAAQPSRFSDTPSLASVWHSVFSEKGCQLV